MSETIRLGQRLVLPRCPHCSIASPNLFEKATFHTGNDAPLRWRCYCCGSCAMVVLAYGHGPEDEQPVAGMFPTEPTLDPAIPERARAFLSQARNSVKVATSGAIVLAASAVDAMMKEKGKVEGTLNARIAEAKASHMITADMADWAHEVRLGANSERHADHNASLPTEEEARTMIAFAEALAEYLFVLPARIRLARKQ